MHFRSGMLFIFDQCLLSIKSFQKKWKGKGQPKMLFFIKNSGFEAHQLSAPRKLSSIAPSASSTIPVLRSTIPFLRPTIPVHRPTIPIHLPASSNFSCSYFNHHIYVLPTFPIIFSLRGIILAVQTMPLYKRNPGRIEFSFMGTARALTVQGQSDHLPSSMHGWGDWGIMLTLEGPLESTWAPCLPQFCA